MKISQLKQPYKKMAQFYTNDDRKKQRGLDLVDAFEWGYCVNSKYTKSHKNFWLSVDLGESPKIPKAILDHFNKHNPKQAFTVMGLPKDFSKETEQVAPVNKLKSTESYDHLLNKMMKGFDFKFDTANTSLPYVIDMDYYIGQTGKITAVFGDIVEVSFGTLTWMYPSHLAKDHVVEDLIGRKMTAFKFESGTHGIGYAPAMDNLLGYDGTIKAVDSDAVHVTFETREGTKAVRFPFGKDVKSSVTGRSAESFLIPEEEVQKALGNMPEKPFKVGETVYLRGNVGQYKCIIDRIYFRGNCPISLDAGKRTILQDIRIDGKRSPKGDVVLSHTPWCDESGVPLEIHNLELEEPKSEKIEDVSVITKAMETVHLFANILKGVHSFTGEITPEDIDYHISLIERHLPK